MNTTQTRSNRPVGILKVSEQTSSYNDALAGILSEIFKTREVRQLLITFVPEFMNAWAGKSWWKKTASKMAGSMVDRQLSQPEDVFENDELTALFEDEEFIRSMAEQLPGIINAIVNALAAGTGSIENMSAKDKKLLFEEFLSKTGKGKTGDVLTSCVKTMNDIHELDPEFFTKAFEPGFKKWVESVDFGELRELFDTSGQDGRKFITMVNTILWQYPTKMIMLLSFLPSFLNFIVDVFEISVDKFNELPPDMLSDVIISFVGEINVDTIAKSSNQLTELIRKIHTGSALIGDPGTPKLTKNLSEMIEKIIDKTDPVTFWKAKIALAEITTSIDEAITEAVSQNDAFRNLGMIKGPEITNIGVKSLNKKLSSWDLVDDAEMAKSFGQHLAAYNVQEIGEVLNNTFRIINRLGDENPEMFSEIAGQLVNSIDTYELEQTAKHLFNGIGPQVQPAARAVIPGLITWLCDVVKPCDDEFEDDAQKARQALQSIFASQEE